MGRKVKTGLLAAAVLLIAAMILIPLLNKGKRDRRIPVNLNKTLTNELSDTAVLHPLDKEIEKYMKKWNLNGVSLSIMRNDSLLYAKGYGIADEDVPMTPGTIMRVASVSKLLTATGIMIMQEQGLLSIDDSVFVDGGILSCYSDAIKDKRIYNITIRNLLMHSAGFTARVGDPMFVTRDLMHINRWVDPPDSETLVRTVLKRKLQYAPGEGSEYSNFGYLLLSLIIEKASGESYERWMQENVLRKAGCVDMHIAGNFYKDKRRNESKYFVQSNEPEIERYDNSGIMVTRCYGGSNVTALQGAGAWVCSTPELARFIASIDGRPGMKDIISPESVQAMTFTTDSVTFALGWNDISKEGVWTRTGTLSGTSALIKCYPDGECWIMVSNTSTWRGPRFTKYTSTLFRRLRESYSAKLPARDLFYRQRKDN